MKLCVYVCEDIYFQILYISTVLLNIEYQVKLDQRSCCEFPVIKESDKYQLSH